MFCWIRLRGWLQRASKIQKGWLTEGPKQWRSRINSFDTQMVDVRYCAQNQGRSRETFFARIQSKQVRIGRSHNAFHGSEMSNCQ